MVIGIDASRYGHPESTGVEWYSYHLLNELMPLLGRDHNSAVKLYAPNYFKMDAEAPFNVKKKIIPFKKFWTLLRLSFELLLHPVDVLFVPSHTLPLIFPAKSIITIHDVAFKKLKDSYSWFQYRLLNGSTKKAVKKAWKIIVPSNATKDDLINLFRCDERKIVVIPHGAPRIDPLQKSNPEQTQAVLKEMRLSEKDLIILYVGRLETKKNLGRLIEAYKRFLKEFPGWKLVLAGMRGTGFEKIWQKVEELELQEDVIMPGYIKESEKNILMERCRIFAFPSLYEGFGLPILEAFAYRRPVLTSNSSSMPEVAGDAAYLVNPLKTEEIGVGLKRLASDGILVTQLIGKSEYQLNKFDWEKAAKATFEVIFDGEL